MDPIAGGRRAVALVASIIVLSSCTGSGTPRATDATPSLSPSVSLSPTPSQAPEEHCGYPFSSFPVSINARGGVAADILNDVREGVRLAQDAYRAKIPTCERGQVRVQVLDRDRGTIAGQTFVQNAPDFRIEFFAKGAFARTPPTFRPIIVLHEWYHVLQFAFIDCGVRCLPLSERIPDWLIEGAAVEESLAEAADAQIGFYSFFRSSQIAQAERVDQPLEKLTRIKHPDNRYGLAFAAVELLVAQHGHASLERLWARTGSTGDWQLAFRRTFGEPVARFYKEFEAYRVAGFRR